MNGAIFTQSIRQFIVPEMRPGDIVILDNPSSHQGAEATLVGDNRRLLMFGLNELPKLARGVGQRLQRYRDGGLSDAITFRLEDGISWPMGGDTGRTRTGGHGRMARGAAGWMSPKGFPASGRFRE